MCFRSHSEFFELRLQSLAIRDFVVTAIRVTKILLQLVAAAAIPEGQRAIADPERSDPLLNICCIVYLCISLTKRGFTTFRDFQVFSMYFLGVT